VKAKNLSSESQWEREQFQHMLKCYHDNSPEGIRKVMKLADTDVAELCIATIIVLLAIY